MNFVKFLNMVSENDNSFLDIIDPLLKINNSDILKIAIRDNYNDQVKYLINNKKYDPLTWTTDTGYSCIMCAIIHKNLNIAEWLIDNSFIDINYKHPNLGDLFNVIKNTSFNNADKISIDQIILPKLNNIKMYKNLEHTLAEQTKTIENLQANIVEKDKIIQDLQNTIVDQTNIITRTNITIAEQDKTILTIDEVRKASIVQDNKTEKNKIYENEIDNFKKQNNYNNIEISDNDRELFKKINLVLNDKNEVVNLINLFVDGLLKEF